jgi:hypothetical protein
MEREEINAVVRQLRKILEMKTEGGLASIKLLEILEMLIDRREEDDLLVKERLEEIIENRE